MLSGLFNRALGRETKVMATVICRSPSLSANGSISSTSQYWSYSPEDFKKLPDQIAGAINYAESFSKLKPLAITIQLAGKLEGRDIQEEFKDFESCSQFLKNNTVISSEMKLRR